LKSHDVLYSGLGDILLIALKLNKIVPIEKSNIIRNFCFKVKYGHFIIPKKKRKRNKIYLKLFVSNKPVLIGLLLV
jgi:hypothetical protein